MQSYINRSSMRSLIVVAVLVNASLCSAFMTARSHQPSFNRNTLRMSKQADYALLFDCDGVIVETEVNMVSISVQ